MKKYNGYSYASRNRALRQLGFKDYREYLASPLWAEIKRKVYKAQGGDCYLCLKPATVLHHNRYHRNDLLGKRTKFIKPICHGCHEAIEFRGEKKATVKQAAAAFKARRRALKGGRAPEGTYFDAWMRGNGYAL